MPWICFGLFGLPIFSAILCPPLGRVEVPEAAFKRQATIEELLTMTSGLTDMDRFEEHLSTDSAFGDGGSVGGASLRDALAWPRSAHDKCPCPFESPPSPARGAHVLVRGNFPGEKSLGSTCGAPAARAARRRAHRGLRSRGPPGQDRMGSPC